MGFNELRVASRALRIAPFFVVGAHYYCKNRKYTERAEEVVGTGL